MAVRLAVLPTSAVSAAVVEVKATTVHQGLCGGSGAGSPGGRGRRIGTRSTVHLVLLLHFIYQKILIYTKKSSFQKIT
jgi:hypothetical protein